MVESLIQRAPQFMIYFLESFNLLVNSQLHLLQSISLVRNQLKLNKRREKIKNLNLFKILIKDIVNISFLLIHYHVT